MSKAQIRMHLEDRIDELNQIVRSYKTSDYRYKFTMRTLQLNHRLLRKLHGQLIQ